MRTKRTRAIARIKLDKRTSISEYTDTELLNEVMERVRYKNGGHESCYFIDASTSLNGNWVLHSASAGEYMETKGVSTKWN